MGHNFVERLGMVCHSAKPNHWQAATTRSVEKPEDVRTSRGLKNMWDGCAAVQVPFNMALAFTTASQVAANRPSVPAP
eukprot:6099076-Amphidinium_carterae.2